MKRHIDFISGPAKRTPDAIAIIADQARLTFSELDFRTAKLVSAFRGAGMEVGDRVALLCKNELEYVEIQAACHRAGFILVPLNYRLAVPELQFILDDSEPVMLIGGRDEHDRLKQLHSMVRSVRKVIGLGETNGIESYDDFVTRATPEPGVDPLDPDLISTILYTSGTTGKPKGAVIDRKVLSARVFLNAIELQFSEDDVFIECLPMFHLASGLTYAALFCGATVVMLSQFTPEKCIDLLQKERATSMVLVPTMIKMLLDAPAIENYDPSHLRLIIYGGESIAPPILKRAVERFNCGFHQQYGMTETALQSALRCGDHLCEDENVIGSAGTDGVCCEVRVVDDDDNEIPDGTPGEIVCRGPAVMSGYWRKPRETEETLRHGWMHTGDVGFRDAKGYLHIVDRKNDMIISGGENIYPREIELVLLGHPRITEAAIVGLPDPKWGEIVTCALVGDTPDRKELEAYLRKYIAGYKIPRKWIWLDGLPHNPTGKVLKNELRKLLKNEGAYIKQE